MSRQSRTYRNLIVLLTRNCPLNCPECNISPAAGDQGPTLRPERLKELFSPDLRQRVKGGVIWSGGEPFSALPELTMGLALASAQGFHSEILTAGTWLSEIDLILPQLLPYREGINLRISLDGPHLRQFPQTELSELIETLYRAGIKIGFTLRSQDPYLSPELEEKRRTVMDRLLAFSPAFFEQPHVIHQMPHMPSPPEQIEGDRTPPITGPEKRCKLADKDFVLAWDGRRYACCGLFFPGDNREHALETLDPASNNGWSRQTLFSRLRTNGPLGLARELGIPLPYRALSPLPVCSQCRYLFHHHRRRLLDDPGPAAIDS